jgi:hypothetical protein
MVRCFFPKPAALKRGRFLYFVVDFGYGFSAFWPTSATTHTINIAIVAAKRYSLAVIGALRLQSGGHYSTCPAAETKNFWMAALPHSRQIADSTARVIASIRSSAWRVRAKDRDLSRVLGLEGMGRPSGCGFFLGRGSTLILKLAAVEAHGSMLDCRAPFCHLE